MAGTEMRVLRTAFELTSILRYKTASKPSPHAVPVTPLATPLDAVYAITDLVFEIPRSKCYYSCLFSYGVDGWNPFVQTLVEYGSGRCLTYKGSLLEQYYERFRPRTTLDLYLSNLHGATVARSPLHRFMLDTYEPILPWSWRISHSVGECGLHVSHGHQAYGPVSEVKGQLEFSRLTSTYESIKRNGYRPLEARGEISGYFLKRQSEYRFRVRGGFHRMAALAALGHDPVRVKFHLHYPRVIDIADLEHWPQVKSGIIDAELAEAIFLTYFGDGGRAKGRELRLQCGETERWTISPNRHSAAREGSLV